MPWFLKSIARTKRTFRVVEDQDFTLPSTSADWRRIKGGEDGTGERPRRM
jgi:hypothetical protein